MLYRKNFFLDMFLGVPFQVGLFRGSALTVLPRCRFVPHLQCYRAGQTRSLFPLCSSALQVRPSLAMLQSGADTLLFPLRPFALQVRPLLAMLQNGSDSVVPPSLSSTLQVRSSLAMLQNGSVSGVPPSLSSTLQVRPSLAMLQNGFGQPCSLTIPNAMKRLPAPLPGHLSSAWCCQTERNTCRLSHGCTPFRCGIGLRRYGLRCLLALHRVPR